jgi:hypothetical protein
MANAPVLTPQALQQLRAQLDAALAAPSPVPAAAKVGAPGAALDFCSIWPTAKPVLQAIVAIIGFIPGLGTGAGAALNALIAVGDQVYNATCPH